MDNNTDEYSKLRQGFGIGDRSKGEREEGLLGVVRPRGD